MSAMQERGEVKTREEFEKARADLSGCGKTEHFGDDSWVHEEVEWGCVGCLKIDKDFIWEAIAKREAKARREAVEECAKAVCLGCLSSREVVRRVMPDLKPQWNHVHDGHEHYCLASNIRDALLPSPVTEKCDDENETHDWLKAYYGGFTCDNCGKHVKELP